MSPFTPKFNCPCWVYPMHCWYKPKIPPHHHHCTGLCAGQIPCILFNLSCDIICWLHFGSPGTGAWVHWRIEQLWTINKIPWCYLSNNGLLIAVCHPCVFAYTALEARLKPLNANGSMKRLNSSLPHLGHKIQSMPFDNLASEHRGRAHTGVGSAPRWLC